MIGAVRSTRVLIGTEVKPATVVFEHGAISAVLGFADAPPDTTDFGDLVVMPALVDSHVHVNEPGRTAWEGFATATAAARAGGVAVIVDMPLNSIPATTTPQALEVKRRAATVADLSADVGFWGGIVPGNLDEVGPLAAAGVRGFKCFLVESGVDEFPAIGLEDLDAALSACAGVGLPLLVHAESPEVIAAAPAAGPGYASYLASRPPAAEVEAIEAVIAAARRTDGRAHILHLSAADALPAIARAKGEGVAITVETCPHYLTLAAEEITDENLAAKCAPPIRDAVNRDRLWDGLADGTIDMVVSDHSPCSADLKRGGFDTAWGGIASLELRLALVWTEAMRRQFELADLARWLCTAPARLAGVATGAISPGGRADLVVWDPDATSIVEPLRMTQRHPITPYGGRSLRGRVVSTIVRGGHAPHLIPENP
ncbi:MAG: allantoinase AllB [Acidimicrobiia bacterium]|nr:allantoinase AllB [Acidimicrobiia bacterium]